MKIPTKLTAQLTGSLTVIVSANAGFYMGILPVEHYVSLMEAALIQLGVTGSVVPAIVDASRDGVIRLRAKRGEQ